MREDPNKRNVHLFFQLLYLPVGKTSDRQGDTYLPPNQPFSSVGDFK